MKLVEKNENKIVFTEELNESLANAIRKYIGQIPILAVDEVEISKNGSPLYDETIAHRIGLLVLKTNKPVNEKTNILLKLDSKKEGMIYSEELKGGAKVVYDKVPITSLKKGQELILNARAKMGRGIKHSKFSPGLMFYRNIINIKVDKNCPKEVIDGCPQKVLEAKDGKVIVKDILKCDMCESCTDLCKKQGKDTIKLIPTKDLVITIESFGQISVQDILKKSAEILKKDLAEVAKKAGK